MRMLLLGAGFSRNWGAPLSEEINGSLLSELHDDSRLAQQLRERPFEEVFGGFFSPSGNEGSARQQLRLQDAVKNTFERVNSAFHVSNFEFKRSELELIFSVAYFLQRFDLIFSLNQDLLLEKCYMVPGRLRAVVRPGLRKISDDIWQPNGQYSGLQLGATVQPYIKLHGSTDWESESGTSVLIMGNAKSGAIAKVPLLQWYHQEFERYLRSGNTKLMVIGYSFQDEHINQVIYNASRDCGLKTFIIDPLGTVVLIDRKMSRAFVRPRRDIEEITIIGELRRTLREIFSGDRFAAGEIARFFET
jgi:hypothetical protein